MSSFKLVCYLVLRHLRHINLHFVLLTLALLCCANTWGELNNNQTFTNDEKGNATIKCEPNTAGNLRVINIYSTGSGLSKKNYIVIEPTPNSHHKYGSWSSTNLTSSKEQVSGNNATIQTNTILPYWYTYTFTYKPEITIQCATVDINGNNKSTTTDPAFSASIQNALTPAYYESGQTINLQYNCTNDEYYFDHWERTYKNKTTNITTPYEVEGPEEGKDITITAVFRKKPHLYVKCKAVGINENQTLTGVAGGSISGNNLTTSSLTDFDLGYFTPNSTIELTATPDHANEFYFDEWQNTGELLAPSGNPYTHTMGTTNRTITAQFRKMAPISSYSNISIKAIINGVTQDNTDPNNKVIFDGWVDNIAKTVWMNAIPNSPNYDFDHWNRPVFGNTTDARIYFSLVFSGAYTAYFQKVKSTIWFKFKYIDSNETIISTDESFGQVVLGNETITYTEDTELHLDINTTHTLTASPTDDCYEFDRWEIENADAFADNTNSGPQSFTVKTTDDAIYTAVFRKKQFTITTSVYPAEAEAAGCTTTITIVTQ